MQFCCLLLELQNALHSDGSTHIFMLHYLEILMYVQRPIQILFTEICGKKLFGVTISHVRERLKHLKEKKCAHFETFQLEKFQEPMLKIQSLTEGFRPLVCTDTATIHIK